MSIKYTYKEEKKSILLLFLMKPINNGKKIKQKFIYLFVYID